MKKIILFILGFLKNILKSSSFTNKSIKRQVDVEDVATCPSCQTILAKVPPSKTVCKNCHQFIFVRTHFKTGKKLYLNQARKNIFEKESSNFYFQKRWSREFSGMGIKEDEIEKLRMELLKKWGKIPSFNDLAWKVFNSQVVKLAGRKSLQELKMLYFTWALFACEINSDPTDLLRQSHKYGLTSYKNTGFVKEVEVLSNNGCGECEKLNKKRFKINDLLKINNVLPNKLCSHKLSSEAKYPWCRCIFIAVTGLS